MMFQSVERICVPSNVDYLQLLTDKTVSIRRTDLCAFELWCINTHITARISSFNPSNGFVCLRTAIDGDSYRAYYLFQSVERICVPSNTYCKYWRCGSDQVSIRRTDLCAFEPLAAYCDRCAFLRFQSVERICVPSNNFIPCQFICCIFVSIRRTDLCAFELRYCAGLCEIGWFQSVERICVPSNSVIRF